MVNHIFKFFIAAALVTATSCNSLKNNKKMEMQSTENTELFPKGDRTPAEYFTGNAYLHPILPKDKNNNYVIGSVTFEPGARTNWHAHPKGQVLIITEGKGIYQEKGKPAQVIKKGDVINIPENLEHWHGATAQTKMVHIAITNYEGEVAAKWLNPVSDDEYNQANQ